MMLNDDVEGCGGPDRDGCGRYEVESTAVHP
jgi:hypothetical protein